MKLKNEDRWFNFWLEHRGVTFVSCRFAELVADRIEQLAKSGTSFLYLVDQAIKDVLHIHGGDLSDKFDLLEVHDPRTREVILLDAFRILEEVWEMGDLLAHWRKNHGDPQISPTPDSAESGASGKKH